MTNKRLRAAEYFQSVTDVPHAHGHGETVRRIFHAASHPKIHAKAPVTHHLAPESKPS